MTVYMGVADLGPQPPTDANAASNENDAFRPSVPFIESTDEERVSTDLDGLTVSYFLMSHEQLEEFFGKGFEDSKRFRAFLDRYSTQEKGRQSTVRLRHESIVVGTGLRVFMGTDTRNRPALYGESTIICPNNMPNGVKEGRQLIDEIKQGAYKVSVNTNAFPALGEDVIPEISLTKRPKVKACSIVSWQVARASNDNPSDK